MNRSLAAVVAVFIAGCGSSSGIDAGAGGGGGTATGGGGGSVAGGGGGSTTGGGGGSSWDGGSSGTLVGTEAFSIGRVTSGFQSLDGGFMAAVRVGVFYFDKPGVSSCTSPNTPFSSVDVQIQLPDAGVVVPGTFPINDTTFVSRVDYSAGGMVVGVGGIGRTGSVTLSRFDAQSSAGTFSTTYPLQDGGTAALSGSWNTEICQ